MTTLREAARRVLAEHDAGFHGLPLTEALEALRDALAEPVQEQEPLGWAVQIGTHSAGRRQGKPRYVLFFNKSDAEHFTLSKPCGSLGEDVSLCRYPDCAGGQAGTICNSWCPGARK